MRDANKVFNAMSEKYAWGETHGEQFDRRRFFPMSIIRMLDYLSSPGGVSLDTIQMNQGGDCTPEGLAKGYITVNQWTKFIGNYSKILVEEVSQERCLCCNQRIPAKARKYRLKPDIDILDSCGWNIFNY